MRLRICLICVLVSATWIGLLIARGLGYPVDLSLIAMLMGGSVVGITYTLSKRLDEARVMPWKLTAIPLGFLIVYAALYQWWPIASTAAIIVVALGFYFFRKSSSMSARAVDATELEKKMKECC
jgi:hypothetical protein